MYIKRQIDLSLCFFGIILLILFIITSIVVIQTEDLQNKVSLANSIVTDSHRLLFITNDYILNNGEIQKKHMDDLESRMYTSLNNFGDLNPEDQIYIDQTLQNLNKLSAFISDYSEQAKSINPADRNAESENIAISETDLLTISITDRTQKLKSELSEEINVLYHLLGLLLLAFIILTVLFILYTYKHIIYELIAGLSIVQEGASIVGRGNLEEQIKYTRDDEIGEVTAVFNKMTNDLRNTLVSRNELEDEIVRRRKAEDELLEKNTELDCTNEELENALNEALASEEKYRRLFTEMKNGFAHCFVKFDDKGNAVDIQFKTVNPAFMKALKYNDFEGKWLSELNKNIQKKIPSNFLIYVSVAKHGISQAFDSFIEETGRWVHIFCYSPNYGEFVSIHEDITEKKNIEIALEKSVIKFRSLYENMINGFGRCKLIYDESGKPVDYEYIMINASYEKLFNLSDIVGKKGSEVHSKTKFFYRRLKIFNDVIINKKQVTFDEEYKKINKWIRVVAYPMPDEDFAIIVEDTTDKKINETRILESEKKYRNLIEGMSIGLIRYQVFFDDDGHVANMVYNHVNKQAEEILGKEDLVGKSISESFHSSKALESFENVITTGRPEAFDEYYKPNGRWFHIYVYSVKHEELVALLEDITERKTIELKLLKSEKKYKILFESMVNGFVHAGVVFDEAGNPVDIKYLSANKAFYSMFKLQNVIEKSFSELFSFAFEDGMKRVESWINIAINRSTYEYDDYYKPTDRWFHFFVYSPSDNEIVAIIRDVTDEKKNQVALVKSERQYKQLFDYMINGLAYGHIVYDEDNKPVDLKIVRANKLFEEILDVKEIADRNISEVFSFNSKEYQSIFDKTVNTAYTGVTTTFDHHYEINGKWLHSIIYSPAKDEFVIFLQDITDKKMAAAALEDSEKYYHNLISEMFIGFFHSKIVYDDNNKPIDLEGITNNKAFEELVGFNGVTGKRITSLHPNLEFFKDQLNKYDYVCSTGETDIQDMFWVKTAKWLHICIYTPKDGEIIMLFEDITNEKTIETEGKRREVEIKKSFTDSLMEGYILISPDKKVIEANEEFLKLFGLVRENVIDKLYYDVFPKMASNQSVDAIENAFLYGKKCFIENSWTNTDGRVSYIRSSVHLTPTGVSVLIVDITEQKERELLIKDSEERLRILFEKASEGIVYIEPENMTIIQINQSYEKMLGYESGELNGKCILDLHSPEFTTEDAFNLFNDFMEGKKEIERSVPLRRKDGTIRYFDIYPTPIHLENESYLISIVTDITKNLKIEKELSAKNSELIKINKDLDKSYKMFQLLANYTYDWEYWIDNSGNFVFITPSVIRMTGYSPEEFYIDPDIYTKIIHPDYHELIKRENRRTKNGEYREVEFRIITKSGKQRWIGNVIVDVIDENGNIIGERGSNRDITLRKKTQKSLELSNERLNQKVDLKTHELTVANTELKESHERLEKMQNILEMAEWISHNGSFEINFDSKQIVCSDELFRIFGYEPSSIEPSVERFYEHVLPEDREKLKTAHEDAIISKEACERNFRIYLKNASKLIKNLNIHFQFKFHGDGTPKLMYGSIQDLSDIFAIQRERERVSCELEDLYNNAPCGYHSVDKRGIIIRMNDTELNWLQYNKTEVIGIMKFKEFVIPQEHDSYDEMFQNFLNGKITHNRQFTLTKKNGNNISVMISVSSITDIDDMNLISRTIVFDNTELVSLNKTIETQLIEKDKLLKEIHHRVKNNMQIISSLLFMQARTIDDPEVVQILRESQDRIKSMALVHEKLYQANSFSDIDYGNYLKNILSSLMQSYNVDQDKIKSEVNVYDLTFDIDKAVPCGLILNELISNSLKHAFPDGRSGKITINVKLEDDMYVIVYSDDGVGIPDKIKLGKLKTSIGLQLIDGLIKQLDGISDLDRSNGTKYTIKFHK